MIKKNNDDTIIIKKSRKSINISLFFFGILLIIIWVFAALGYYKFGISTGIISIIFTVLYGFTMLGIFRDVPKSLELHDNQIIYTRFLFNEIFSIPYSDIQELEFTDYSTGKGKILNYYLVAKCNQSVSCKISLRGLISNPKEQEEIIQFILGKNSHIKFPYRLSRYNEWVNVNV
ncbi:MAG: hypothetical protein P4L59_17705 [Desulfosporosinus sp.]|nr:hypothetical protein [Desulfosporosinus sp.]